MVAGPLRIYHGLCRAEIVQALATNLLASLRDKVVRRPRSMANFLRLSLPIAQHDPCGPPAGANSLGLFARSLSVGELAKTPVPSVCFPASAYPPQICRGWCLTHRTRQTKSDLDFQDGVRNVSLAFTSPSFLLGYTILRPLQAAAWPCMHAHAWPYGKLGVLLVLANWCCSTVLGELPSSHQWWASLRVIN